MRKFEYKLVIRINSMTLAEQDKYLNELGQDGWELVTANDDLFRFKREAQPHQSVPEGWKNKITGHFLTDVICSTDCQHCHQGMFHWCQDGDGEWSNSLHGDRIQEFMNMSHFNAANYVDFQKTLRQ